MEDESAKKFYPGMYEKQTSDGFDYYNHGKGMEGLEPHDFRRPPEYGNELTGIDTIHTKDVPNFLREKLQSAVSFGKLPEVYRHYVKELRKEGKYGPAMDEKTLRTLEKHIDEVDKAITYQDQQEAYKVIADYLGRIRVTKREG